MSKTKEILYQKSGQHCGTCGEPIDYNHGKMVSCEVKWIQAMKSKEEAVAFANKYLGDRRNDYTKFHTFFQDEVSGIDFNDANKALERAWDIATDYIILDIIPHLYGEALD